MHGTIVCVWGDRMVNLQVVDHGGTTHALRSVTLRHGDEGYKPSGAYCVPADTSPAEVAQPDKLYPASELKVQLLDATAPTAASPCAPRVTLQHIAEVIVDTEFFRFPGTTVTVCLLTLKNGFSVLGESACASPENFDEAIGQKIALSDATEKIWALEGYLLREKLSNPVETD
jgi:hypothetical protein